MKRFLQVASTLYVAFAILAAYTAVAPTEKATANSSDQQATMVTLAQSVRDYQRLDFTDTATARSVKSKYEIRVWSSNWCGACKTYKRREVPALLKAGYKVKVLDYDTENPPEEIRMLPTIQLVFNGRVLKTEVYWRAKDIDKYVEGLLMLKK